MATRGSVLDLQRSLNELENRLQNLVNLRQQLTDFGGSVEYIQRLQHEIERLNGIVQQYSAHSTNYGARHMSNDALDRETAVVNEEVRRAQDMLAAATDKVAAAQQRLAHSSGTLRDALDVYYRKNQDIIAQSPYLTDGFDRLIQDLSNVNSRVDFDNIAQSFKRFKIEVSEASASFKEQEADMAKLARGTQKLSNDIDLFFTKNQDVIVQNDKLKDSFASLLKGFQGITNQEDLDNMVQSFKRFVIEVAQAEKETKNLDKQLKKTEEDAKAAALANASEVANFVTAIKTKIIDSLWNTALSTLRSIFEATKQLDAELVEIRKVTNLTEKELTSFVKNIQEIGGRTATVTSQLLEASAVFARSGFSTEQIAKLTEEAAVLKNVSDGITDMSQSAQVLISVMKAYDIPAEKARVITDQLNIISNNAAISFDDLAEGVRRVGSVFASQDTSIGQLSAMLTGANEILQDIAKTSNGLKTISQRLRQIKGDSAKLQDLISGITEKYGVAVNITDTATGQLRGTYDILKDLAGVWERLSKNEQQLIGEQLAGKNQITVLQALLNNWEGVETAIKNVENATGSAAREQKAYLNSLTGALAQLQASLENMYASVQASPMLTFLVKLSTSLVDIVNNIGILPTAIGLVSGKSASLIKNITRDLEKLSGLAGDSGLGGTVKELVKSLNIFRKSDILSGYTDKLKEMNSLTEEEQKSFLKLLRYDSERNLSLAQRIALSKLQQKADTETISLLGKQLALEQAISAVRSIAISLLVTVGIAALTKFFNYLKKERSNIIKTYNDTQEKISDIKEQIKSINDDIANMGGQKTVAQNQQLEQLNLELERTRALAEKARQKFMKLVESSFREFGTEDSYIKFNDEESGFNINLEESDIIDMINNIQERYTDALEIIENGTYDFLSQFRDTSNERFAEFISQLDNLKEKVEQYEKEQHNLISLGITEESVKGYLSTAIEDAIDEISNEIDWHKIFEGLETLDVQAMISYFGQPINDFIDRLHQINKENIDMWQQQYTEIYAVSRGLQDYVSLYEQAVGEMSSSQLLNILDNWEKYADVLVVENGQLKISKELVVRKAKAQLESIKATLRAKIADMEQTVSLEKIELAATQQALNNTRALINANNRKIESTSKYVAIKKAQIMAEKGEMVEADRYMADVSRYQTSINNLTVAIANQESYINNLKGQIEALDKLNLDDMLASIAAEANKASKSTSKAASSTSQATEEAKKLAEELKKLKDLLSTLQKQMTDTTDVYKKVQSAMKDIVQAEIDALENENDSLDEGMKYYEARIKLIEEYYKSEIEGLKEQQKAAEEANEAEQKAVKEKIEALKEATKEYEKQNKLEQDAIDTQIKALEEEIKAIDEANKSREDELDMQERLLEIEKARLAAEKAKDAYEAAKKNKNVRTYDAERGWTYTADQGAVASSYKEYASAQREYEKLLEELEKIKKANEIQAQKDVIQAEIDSLNSQKESLKELLEQTKENAEKQEEAWDEEIDLLKEQKDAIAEDFERQIDELEKQSDSLSNIEDDIERMLDQYFNDEEVLAWVEAYKNASEEERKILEEQLRDQWKTDKEGQQANEERIAELKDLLDKIGNMLETVDSVLESEGVKSWLESFKAGDYAQRDDMILEMTNAYQDFVKEQQARMDKVQASIDKLEGTINITNEILSNWGSGKGNTPINNYANGGVVDSGLLNSTGMLSDRVKVHGTRTNPEVILNGRQQANLLYRLGQQRPNVVNNSSNSAAQSVYIATLNIRADSQDTLHGLLLQAKQLAMVS